MNPFAWEWWRFAWSLNPDRHIEGYRRVVARLWWREGETNRGDGTND